MNTFDQIKWTSIDIHSVQGAVNLNTEIFSFHYTIIIYTKTSLNKTLRLSALAEPVYCNAQH